MTPEELISDLRALLRYTSWPSNAYKVLAESADTIARLQKENAELGQPERVRRNERVEAEHGHF